MVQTLWNKEESKGSVHLEPLPETNDEIMTRDYLAASLTREELDFRKYRDLGKVM